MSSGFSSGTSSTTCVSRSACSWRLRQRAPLAARHERLLEEARRDQSRPPGRTPAPFRHAGRPGPYRGPLPSLHPRATAETSTASAGGYNPSAIFSSERPPARRPSPAVRARAESRHPRRRLAPKGRAREPRKRRAAPTVAGREDTGPRPPGAAGFSPEPQRNSNRHDFTYNPSAVRRAFSLEKCPADALGRLRARLAANQPARSPVRPVHEQGGRFITDHVEDADQIPARRTPQNDYSDRSRFGAPLLDDLHEAFLGAAGQLIARS